MYLRASGMATVSRSSWSSRCTSTPRSRSVSAKASCSCLARLTQSTSSKRYSSWLRRRQPLQLEVRSVQDRLSQAADLRIDVQVHDSLSSGACGASWPRVPQRVEGPPTSRADRHLSPRHGELVSVEPIRRTSVRSRGGTSWPLSTGTCRPGARAARPGASDQDHAAFRFPSAFTVLFARHDRGLAAGLHRPDRRATQTDAESGAPIPGSYERTDTGLSFGDRLMELFLAPDQRPVRRDEPRRVHRPLRVR